MSVADVEHLIFVLIAAGGISGLAYWRNDRGLYIIAGSAIIVAASLLMAVDKWIGIVVFATAGWTLLKGIWYHGDNDD